MTTSRDVTYVRPRIETLSAGELQELLGPVQGYGYMEGGGGGTGAGSELNPLAPPASPSGVRR